MSDTLKHHMGFYLEDGEVSNKTTTVFGSNVRYEDGRDGLTAVTFASLSFHISNRWSPMEFLGYDVILERIMDSNDLLAYSMRDYAVSLGVRYPKASLRKHKLDITRPHRCDFFLNGQHRLIVEYVNKNPSYCWPFDDLIVAETVTEMAHLAVGVTRQFFQTVFLAR